MWHQDFVHTLGYLSLYNVRRPTHVLASASRDGGLAIAAAEGVGFRRAVRGSSARGGAGALLKLHRMAKTGRTSFAVVCDGPRPPARVLKPGVLHLARDSGLPLWLVRTSYRPVKVLSRSWAAFHLPRLGARAVCLADGPIHVPPDLDRVGLERVRARGGGAAEPPGRPRRCRRPSPRKQGSSGPSPPCASVTAGRESSPGSRR